MRLNTRRFALWAAGAFDTFLNVQITLVLALQMALCLTCALVSLWWRNSAGYARYYLSLDTYNEGAQLTCVQLPCSPLSCDCSGSLIGAHVSQLVS